MTDTTNSPALWNDEFGGVDRVDALCFRSFQIVEARSMPDRTNSYSKAAAFITDFSRSLLPGAEIVFGESQLRVANQGKRFSVPFTREDLDDLEQRWTAIFLRSTPTG